MINACPLITQPEFNIISGCFLRRISQFQFFREHAIHNILRTILVSHRPQILHVILPFHHTLGKYRRVGHLQFFLCRLAVLVSIRISFFHGNRCRHKRKPINRVYIFVVVISFIIITSDKKPRNKSDYKY